MGEQKRLPSVPMPGAIDPADIHALLQGLDALRPALGKSRLNKFLRGTGTRDTAGLNRVTNPLHGVLRGATRDKVDRFFAALIANGLMHQGDEDAYFVCTITPKGRAAWQERLPLDIPIPRDPGQWGLSDAGGDDVLTELKQWRTAQASQKSLPPYCIFNDKTLMEIARARPQTSDELLAVSGVGGRKLEKYGELVLKITGES